MRAGARLNSDDLVVDLEISTKLLYHLFQLDFVLLNRLENNSRGKKTTLRISAERRNYMKLSQCSDSLGGFINIKVCSPICFQEFLQVHPVFALHWTGRKNEQIVHS